MATMPHETIRLRLQGHLNYLSEQLGPRPSGSAANRAAAEYIQTVFEQTGLDVERQEFPCPSWKDLGTTAELGGSRLVIAANAYSPPCDLVAPMIAVGTLAELEQVELSGHIVVLYGDLVMAPISCKSWFLKSEQDERLIQLLEEKCPLAVITIQPTNDELERMIEDWEFNIPSATVPARSGLVIMDHLSQPLHLKIYAQRTTGSTANVVAHKPGGSPSRIIFMAHYDTKIDTPGALDNASGTAILLALAQSLGRSDLSLGLEWIAFTNEEYLPIGDDEYLRRYEDSLKDIEFAINFDGVGQRLSVNSVAIYTHSKLFRQKVDQIKQNYPGIVWVDPWPESNHSTFAWRGVPCLAFTSRSRTRLAHLRSDTVEWVDPDKLVELVSFVTEIVSSVQDEPSGWTRP